MSGGVAPADGWHILANWTYEGYRMK